MARGCMAVRMPKDWASGTGLWQTFFFSCLIRHIGAPEVPELQCHTDFAAEVVCHWNVNDATSCTEEFRLHYSSSFTKQKMECGPKDRRVLGSARPGCFCVISETVFEATYTLSLESRRDNASRSYTVDLRDIVKPRALQNLTVTKSERRSFILTWRKGYNSPNAIDIPAVFCQVRISSEGQKQPVLKNLTEQVEHYEIFANTLLPGKSYSASVRYKIDPWKSFWSEWSVPCQWSNDFKPEGEDGLWWAILLACFLIMVLVSTCYLCLIRLKRELWDDIPSPGKSNLGKEFGGKPSLAMRRMFLGDEGKGPLYALSQSLLEQRRSIEDSQPKDEATFPGWWNKVAATFPESRLREKWEPFFTPEVPSVEPSLTICRRLDAGSEAQMEEEEDHVPHMDALVDLFLDIQGGGGHVEDAEPPAMPVLEEHPSSGAPEPVLSDLCMFARTPTKSPVGSSPSGYQNSDMAASPQKVSPTPTKHQEDGRPFSAPQYKLLLFPQKLSSASCQATVPGGIGSQANCPGGSRARAAQPSCYKSFSSLMHPSTAGACRPGEHQLDLSGVDQSQPHGSWPSSCEAAAAAAPSQKAPGIPCTIDSCLPGYRPFKTALRPSVTSQDPSHLSLGSPYKPFLGVLRSMPQEAPLGPILRTQEAERETWQRGSLEEPLTFAFSLGRELEEEDSGQKGVRQRASSPKCLLPLCDPRTN
ncbi:interleukin-4 receptor subunit alpha isoform X2 [Eublepharis macularius]|uniref:Interleukin-4 receptor subunit alpha n=1 Tax=Eublepharis macularius TaxID=481883 RepID=A0AA97K2S4_EUBMA|nr:interleukin-4 receptor subunit alpha isoform X2 [Eublepharis macularius]